MARLIDADALLEIGRARKIIEVVGNWHELPGFAKSACVRLGTAHKKMILDAPTVDAVEVVHGRWETANDGTHFCTHCGCDAPYKWDDIDRSFINSADDVPDRPSKYCPNCGALMDGERKDNGI